MEAAYAVVDRWSTRQQQQYGTLREALERQTLTLAIFEEKGTLGTRSNDFLRRAVDGRVFSIGYEHLGHWEYVFAQSMDAFGTRGRSRCRPRARTRRQAALPPAS